MLESNALFPYRAVTMSHTECIFTVAASLDGPITTRGLPLRASGWSIKIGFSDHAQIISRADRIHNNPST